MKNWKFLRVSLFLLAGCGYQWGIYAPDGAPLSLQVPYIKGDDDGSLTSELISELSTSGLFDIKTEDAAYRLDISLVENTHERIGYRRDPQKIKQEIKKNLLGCEERRTLVAEVTIYDCVLNKVFSGPHRVMANVDYDYVDGDSYPQLTFIDAEGKTVVVLPFSLGQLESMESAQEASSRPLYRKISQKIVDVISAEW